MVAKMVGPRFLVYSPCEQPGVEQKHVYALHPWDVKGERLRMLKPALPRVPNHGWHLVRTTWSNT